MRPRAVTGSVMAALGIVALSAGAAWPREPVPRPVPAHPTVRAAPPPAPVPAGSAPSTVDSPVAQPSAPAPVPGWTLVDYDDFTGQRLDRRRWAVYDSTATNGVSRWSPSMVSVADGELRIVGQGRDPDGHGNISGGLCWCNGSGNQTYGMWQVRARFERGTGYGQALLLWPTSDNWPQEGELDFVETPHADKKSAALTVHWGTDNQIDYRWVGGDFTQWHTYTVVWRPGLVQMLIDDKVYYDSTTSSVHPQIPDHPMHLAIQQEPGPLDAPDWVPPPGRDTPDTVTLHIDWVRLYR
jgi:beta-glucanase (GH16 family)